MPTILLTNSYGKEVLELVQSLVPKEFNLISLTENKRSELISKAPEADYFIVSGRLSIDSEVIGAAKKLKMIQRTGVGIDQIILGALKERNIPLYINKGVNAQAVAEHTLMLILAVYRKLTQADQLLKNGIWEKQSFAITTRSLFRKKIGLIGLGSIGIELVKLLQPFEVDIFYYKRSRLDQNTEKRYGLVYSDLKELFQTSDIICPMCAYTTETHEILDVNAFEKMKSDAIIINTARGRLINEDALVDALAQNRIAGAGLDVHYNEPLQTDHPLPKLEQVTLTAHTAGITKESFSEMYIRAFSNISAFENGSLMQIKEQKYINE